MDTSDTESDGGLQEYSDSHSEQQSVSHSEQSVSSEDNVDANKGKRGKTRLPKLLRDTNGERRTVTYDEANQATGKNGCLLSSYIGSEVGPSLGLKYTCWKEVPPVVKKKLWEDVTFKFDLDESKRKDVLRQFSDLWRGWRKRTAAKHVTPFEKSRKKLKNVPSDLRGFVEQEEWKEFVKRRLSDKGKELSEIGRTVQAHHKYPHRMGRRTYAGLKDKLKREGKWTSDSPPPRELLWILARQNENGEYKTDEIGEVAAQIDDCSKKIKEGTIVCEGKTDALVKILGEEHGGRVRAAGTRVTHSQYFDTPRQRGSSNKDNLNKIRELEEQLRVKDVQARISEENLRKEFQQQLEEQSLDTERKLQKQFLQFKELLGKSQYDTIQPPMMSSENVPALGAEDKDLAETWGEAVHDPKGKAQNIRRHNGAKSSKLDARKTSQELNSTSIPASLKAPAQVPNTMLSSKKVVAQPPTGPPHPPSNRRHPCELYDKISRVVALGHVIHSDSKMIHGKKMCDDCLRVSVDFVEIKTAILPYPSGDIVTVYDARESVVQWPKHLVVLVGNGRTRLDAFDEFVKRAKEVFRSRAAIKVELHRDVFGQTVDVPIHMALEDIEFVCTSQKLTNNAIVLFIRFLYEKLDGDARKTKFGFMNPAAVHFSVNKTELVKSLLNRLKDSVPSRKYIFIPCHTGIHWVLSVFFDGVFYYLNSLDEKCRYKLEEQMSTVSKALRKLGVKRSEEKVFWVDVKMFKSGMNYGATEIDEIKREWMDYISPILEKYEKTI
ncbi:hypothetical protein C5167_021435 [Papaver somniferum]|nr:hypothetical protein C5167_021435 [Papaver somniferum]